MNSNLASNLVAAALATPDRPALLLGETAISYRQLDHLAADAAAWLREQGVRGGDSVAIMFPNVVEVPVLYYAVLRLGATVVPLNPLLARREVAFCLRDSNASLLLSSATAAEQARSGADDASVPFTTWHVGEVRRSESTLVPAHVALQGPEDTAVILYTSGTTGQPKGAELTHANLGRNAEVTARTLLELDSTDVVFGGLPLFHSFGQTCGMNAAILRGAALALVPRFTAGAALDTIARHHVTVLEGVPTMYAALLEYPTRERFDTQSLRCCVSGGAALPVEVLRAFEQAFGCVVLEGYGLSETAPVACFNHPDRERVPGSIGTPIDGVEMRIVDDRRIPLAAGQIGEIAIRGHNVMKGYLNQPEATAAAIDSDGWFYSGDIGRRAHDGHYYVVDRKKDLIIRGGYNVYPREIEEVLYEHPAVGEAAVIAIPDKRLGEEVGAAVALRPGSSVSAAELQAWVKAEVAAYKYPRQIWFMDELPKGPTGKILKRAIKAPTAATEHLRG